MWRFLPYIAVPTPEAVSRVAAEVEELQRRRHEQHVQAGIQSVDGSEPGFVSDDERPVGRP